MRECTVRAVPSPEKLRRLLPRGRMETEAPMSPPSRVGAPIWPEPTPASKIQHLTLKRDPDREANEQINTDSLKALNTVDYDFIFPVIKRLS